jgi:hypothetical protein
MKWLYAIAADSILILHLVFVIFAIAGGLLVLWQKRFAWLHVPAIAWAVFVEATGGICPLTPLENFLRIKAGRSAYASGFIEHYIAPILYPPGLTRQDQILLAILVLVINSLVYGWLLYKWKVKRSPKGHH